MLGCAMAVRTNVAALLLIVLALVVFIHSRQASSAITQTQQVGNHGDTPPVWYKLNHVPSNNEHEKAPLKMPFGKAEGTTREDESLMLEYRHSLEYSEYSPVKYDHLPSLGFSHIYVVSLPTRPDRRKRMLDIATALGAEITFIDATSTKEQKAFIDWIGEQVYKVRLQKKKIISKHLGVREDKVGGLNLDCPWLVRSGSRLPSLDPYEYVFSTRAGKKFANLPKFPSLVNEDTGMTWVDKMEEAERLDTLNELVPENININITEILWDPIERIPTRQTVPAVLATYHSHLKAMKSIVKNDDKTALILEDDVDIEWDIERIWKTVTNKIGEEWDITFLGHCWGHEAAYKTGVHPMVGNTDAPRCLHGYAMTNLGAQKLVELFSDPWVAYQTPVDTALPSFILQGLVKGYSLEPPSIIQGKDSPSDIQAGTGSSWRGVLSDSTLERIWRDQGKQVLEMSYEESLKDPAIVRPKDYSRL